METKIIAIGNSKGIRIPKTMLTKHHFNDTVELESHEEGLIIRFKKTARHNRDKKFSDNTIKSKSDDIFEGIQNDFDNEEWTW